MNEEKWAIVISYIVPTLHEKPPYLVWELISHNFWMRRYVRGVGKPFHDHSFAAINLDVCWSCAMGWVIGVGAADLYTISDSGIFLQDGH